MPQGLGKNLYHTLSVYENVDFFARLFGHDKAEREVRINELLTSTGLAPFRDRPAGKLFRRDEAKTWAVLRVNPRPGTVNP